MPEIIESLTKNSKGSSEGLVQMSTGVVEDIATNFKFEGKFNDFDELKAMCEQMEQVGEDVTTNALMGFGEELGSKFLRFLETLN